MSLKTKKKKHPMQMGVSLIIWFFCAVITFALFLVSLILTLALYFTDKDRRVVHAQCFWWAGTVIGFNPYWDVRTSGLENIDKSKTYVVVANHQSLADIAVLYNTHMQFKWVSKESVFKWPVIGWCLSFGKHIKLVRGDLKSIKAVYRQAAEWLRKDISVVFFPEGTRSRTGRMSKFQNGAFKLAIREKRPVLPIALQGTRDTIPRGSWVFKAKAFAKMTVLPAIETKDLEISDFEKLRDLAYNRIESVVESKI